MKHLCGRMQVPLAAWLCAAAQHMGGAALVRKQLSIFW
mgnify:CR=1 FL=1